MNTDHWIFLSPHLDDVALSCGGLVWDLAQRGHQVEVWTLFAGLPAETEYSPFAQQIHALWGISGQAAFHARREEDLAACAVLGAVPRHFDWLDAIYRQDPATGEPIVEDLAALFSRSPEPALVEEIATVINAELPQGSQLVLPIGLGSHIDHQAAVQAGKRSEKATHFYADYPYVLLDFDSPAFQADEWKNVPHPLGQEALNAWEDAVLSYTSQLSSFWRDEDETRISLRNYLAGGGGRLWQKRILT
jgi:LmbE family N-acetylglucosaminyl deacetylase